MRPPSTTGFRTVCGYDASACPRSIAPAFGRFAMTGREPSQLTMRTIFEEQQDDVSEKRVHGGKFFLHMTEPTIIDFTVSSTPCYPSPPTSTSSPLCERTVKRGWFVPPPPIIHHKPDKEDEHEKALTALDDLSLDAWERTTRLRKRRVGRLDGRLRIGGLN